jgi:glycosyltransferase involved in cell wall biosynthesis
LLNRVSIGIKTFLRDSKLLKTISDIRRTMPETQLLIADDGEMTEEKDSVYAELIREGHKVFILPFDSGFGKKANKIIDNLDRDFALVASDDFDFAPPSVRLGVEKMLEVLDQNPELSIVSGRLANRGPYEFYLKETDGVIEEILAPSIPEFFMLPIDFDHLICDVTVNYSLIRKEVFEKVRFDDEEIIGEGGHGAFFYDVKKAGFKVAYIPGVEISEQTGRDSDRYREYRHRACGPSRKCFEKRNICKWILGNGQVDYDVTGEHNAKTVV